MYEHVAFPVPGSNKGKQAIWTGTSFSFDGNNCRVLRYDVGPSGWSDELSSLHAVTDKHHFIDVASRNHTIGEVRRHLKNDRSIILDIGCSTGILLEEMSQSLPKEYLIGADFLDNTLNLVAAKLPNIPLLQFDLTQCPLPNSFADIVIAINMLEHINDDIKAIDELFRILRPGGTAIIEVPARRSLYDIYDHALMHFRRYDMVGLIATFAKAGFIIERRSHLGFFIFPAFYLSKRLNQFRYGIKDDAREKELVAQLISTSNTYSPLLNHLMSFEEMLREFIYFPTGIRCLLTCRKPE